MRTLRLLASFGREWRRFPLPLFLLSLLALPVIAFAQNSPIPQSGAVAANRQPTPEPPVFDPRRYTEDYRYLDDSALHTSAWWEPLKRVRLDPTKPDLKEDDIGGTPLLRLAGEVRVRTEDYTGNLFNPAAPGRQGYIWERVLPYVEVDASPRLRFVLEFEAGYSQGQNPGPSSIDQTGADFLQGFVEISEPTPAGRFAVRLGRQVLSYGDGALIDSRYGPNVLLSFDGAFLNWQQAGWRVDSFYARPVNTALHDFDDATSVEEQVWSVYAGHDVPGPSGSSIDLYYIGFRNSQAVWNGKQAGELRHSIGARYVSGRGSLDYKGDVIAQFGTFGNGSISAGAVAGELGASQRSRYLKPRYHLNSGLASGDTNKASRNLHTFNSLFPRGQYFSDTGLIGPYNIVNLREGVTLNFGKKLNVDTLIGEYWRQSHMDGVYRNGGGLLFPSNQSKDSYVATQIESVADYELYRGLSLRLTLAHFSPGAFIRSTGPHRSVWFVGAESRFWF